MSQPQDQESYYDFDRDILNRTPPPVEIKPIFESQERPLPLVRLYPSSDSADAEDTDRVRPCKKPKKRKGRTNPSFAVGILIRSLDPNQSELASHAERNPLDSGSQSEAEEEDNEAEAGQRQMSRSSEVVQSQALQVTTKPREVAMVALIAIPHNPNKEDDWLMIDTPASAAEEKLPRTPPTPSDGTRRSGHQVQVQTARPSNREDPPKKQFDTHPPPLKEGLGLNLKPSHGHEEDDEDSIIKSPALAKFAIARDNAPPDFILPALQQKSPPRSSPAGLPEQKQSLPNLKTAIGDLQDVSFVGFATMSPMGRPSPGQFEPYASPAPYSVMSPQAPMGPPSHYDFRTTTRESNTSTSSSYTSSSAAASTPSLSIAGPSPAASHPSPLAAVSEQDRDRTRRESFKETESKSQSESQSEAPPADGSSSTHLTQYLLNSHVNVHSNTRTHFCPVKSCPRGIGGQGFKRKNEMTRHGLVHTSPGYICPFCPDRQHKYPRPDNLQRHVRKHHEDKDQDDPILRDVLNQRLEGGSRGGRRRMRL